MNDLVQRLMVTQVIAVNVPPHLTREAFLSALGAGLIHIRFVDTKGPTDLSVAVEPYVGVQSQSPPERLDIAGNLTLDFCDVEFRGTVELDSLAGEGRLCQAAPEPTAGSS